MISITRHAISFPHINISGYHSVHAIFREHRAGVAQAMNVMFSEHRTGMAPGGWQTTGRLLNSHEKSIPPVGKRKGTRIISCYLVDKYKEVICLEIWGNHVDRLGKQVQEGQDSLLKKMVIINNYAIETIKSNQAIYSASNLKVRLKATNATKLVQTTNDDDVPTDMPPTPLNTLVEKMAGAVVCVEGRLVDVQTVKTVGCKSKRPEQTDNREVCNGILRQENSRRIIFYIDIKYIIASNCYSIPSRIVIAIYLYTVRTARIYYDEENKDISY